MNKLYSIIICIGISIAITGCFKSNYDTYIIENKTNYTVAIKGYAVAFSKQINRDSLYNETITILPQSSYKVLKTTGEGSEPRGLFNSNDIDSTSIIFNNERSITYKCNEQNGMCFDTKNILNYQEYFEEKCAKKTCTYTYTITEDDYNAASPIE